MGAPKMADAQDPTKEPHPMVERLYLTGVESVKQKELLNTISTQTSRCRVFFLKPLCALTHNHLFETRNYLDHDQLRRDVLRIKVFYWVRGFRHAQVDTALAPKGRGVAVTFKVREGPPTLISAVGIDQPNPHLSDRRLRRMGMPREGDRIDLTRLDTLRTKSVRALWDMGYGNAEVTDTIRSVDSLHVTLDLLLQSGPITTVDTVVVEGNEKVTARTVRRLVGMRHGDLYKRPDLLEAQRRLYRSDLFRQSFLQDADSLNTDSSKTVVVTVREAPMKQVQAGVGLNTVEFAQVQGNVTLYNFHGSARRLDLHSAIGNLGAKSVYGKGLFGAAVPRGTSGEVDDAFLSPTWQLSGTMTQPWLWSTRNSIGLSIFSNRRSVPGIVIDRGTGASLTFTRTVTRDIPFSLSYRFERSRVEAGELYFCVNFGYCQETTIAQFQTARSFSPFVFNVRADRTDDPLEPHTGYTARIDVEHASNLTASDWSFNRFEAEFTPYLKMGTRTLVVRGHWGKVNGDDLHPRTRFYAGGSRSVRGFAEGQLGPRVLTIDPEKLEGCTVLTIEAGTCDPNNTLSTDFVPRPVGGKSLLEGTLEYRLSFNRALGGAVFVDYGRIGDITLDKKMSGRSAITPGIGFRYSSPIGPVRVDLGLRPTRAEELPVVTQVRDIEDRLHLVELNTLKQYDPMEGPKTFFGGVFRRIQLHLYIGEAY
ncbi:MAG TPA: BamA/TamA family outer membrane protein [Longimicrobiales bacterium]|nr:BamA/TamA family outer membrane protein [Longimicrobiales bacterium]